MLLHVTYKKTPKITQRDTQIGEKKKKKTWTGLIVLVVPKITWGVLLDVNNVLTWLHPKPIHV